MNFPILLRKMEVFTHCLGHFSKVRQLMAHPIFSGMKDLKWYMYSFRVKANNLGGARG